MERIGKNPLRFPNYNPPGAAENDRIQIQETGTCHSIFNNKSIVDSTYHTQKELHADSNKILEQNVKGLTSAYLKKEAVATWIQCGFPKNKSLENNLIRCAVTNTGNSIE